MEQARRAWIRIALADGLGPRTWERLIDELGSAEAVAEVTAARLARVGRIGPERARRFVRALARVDVDGLLGDCEAFGYALLTPADAKWPAARLEGLPDAPGILFAQGPLPAAATPRIAIVGTREASRYGLDVARTFAADLARAGACIVSGFAVGIDAAAHGGALDAGGHTLGVLGAGLDVAYPVANAELREALLEGGGALLSELPPGTPPTRHQFPRRNRLVAALADALVVVEAPRRSGALITAARAADLGRAVLAVPGHVKRRSQAGCHHLIRTGAELCRSAGDVLAAIGEGRHTGTGGATREPVPGPAHDVWQRLDPDDAQELDALATSTGLSVSALLTALAELEVEGFARRVPGVGYLRA